MPGASELHVANPNALLTVKQAAARLNVSQTWVRRNLRSLPTVRLGRSIRFDPQRLERLFTSVCTTPKTEFRMAAAGDSPKPESEFFMLRRYQSGSVYKVGKRVKVWYGMYRTDHKTAAGELVRKQRSVRLGSAQELPTKSAAMEALRKVMGVNSPVSTAMRFSELVEQWKAVEVPAMKKSTADHYVAVLRRIEPVFGMAEITTITRHDVERFVLSLTRKYSKASIRGARTTLSIILKYAVANSWLEKNPVAGVKLPRAENCAGKPIKRCVLTPEQVKKLVAGLDEPYATLVLTLATTGLRICEAAGLRWSDLSGNILNVRRRVYFGEVDEPKSEKSRRQVPISSELAERLLKLRKGDQDTWVFRASNGAALNPGNWMKREVRPASRKLEIGLTGWHDFRHFFSTQLRRDGTHPKLVSNLLGHATVHLALDVYDHVDVGELKAPVERVSSQLLGDVMRVAVSS